ncbi:hypothetical protein FEF10_23425 [Pseudomonas protegens]|uniref:DUF1534 domain-containing protein n=1 Tax=Pseudomonas protegens TaxID=380021 RepID=A0ABY2VGP5_9PSED|nr:hypothetical protein FEF10_23425 [Pseudomonas protegens]
MAWMKPNWPAATRWTASPEPCTAFNDALSRRSRLAGEEALKPCIAPNGAFAGKPDPTAARVRLEAQSTSVQAMTRASSRPPTAG